MHVFKRDSNDDSDGTHLTSIGIEFQTEEEAKENKQAPCVDLLRVGLLRRGMVYEPSWTYNYTLCVCKKVQRMRIQSLLRHLAQYE